MTTASRGAARAIADLDEGTILATVEIAAPPERVFRALTTADEIVRWWGADDLYRHTAWTADVRVGGRWRAEGKGADGRPFSVEGEYVAIDPPHRLVHTWKPEWDGGHVTTVAYRIEATATGSRVTLRHHGFDGRREACEGHGTGWERVLGWLAGHLQPAPAQPIAERFYHCRLMPPRPSFARDMNAEEAAMMQEHVRYWMGHLQAGTAIVFGPVDDPVGAWGLGVVRVADESAVRALEAGDPAIRAGRGLRYEILPMLRAVVAG